VTDYERKSHRAEPYDANPGIPHFNFLKQVHFL
jgi:hypothetical protein